MVKKYLIRWNKFKRLRHLALESKADLAVEQKNEFVTNATG
jgi:hypothetical protein